MTHWRPAIALCLLFASLASTGMPQSTSAEAEVGAALASLEEGRTTLDDKHLSQAREVLARLAQQHPDDALYFFQLARANRYRVEAYSTPATRKTLRALWMKPSATFSSR